jgi:hypothetical protein
MTACQTCRTAKVKCDGQQDCGRCNSRGIICRYARIETPDSDSPPSSDLQSSTSMARPQELPVEMPLNFDSADNTTQFSTASVRNNDEFDTMIEWAPDTGHSSIAEVHWETTDVDMNASLSTFLVYVQLELIYISKVQFQDSLTTLSIVSDLNDIQPLSYPPPHGLTSTPVLSQTDLAGISTTTSSERLSQPDPWLSLPECQCKDSLAIMIPKVSKAMHEKQLDAVFKGTQHVVDGFQNIVDCTHCKITCTDLICTMAMFQQTDAFFEYIAKSDADSTMKMSFGGYEVPINDPKLRAVLVLSLIHQAMSVLDAISSKGREMLQALCTPSPLAQANIGHIDKAVGDFKSVLQGMAKIADQAARIG